MTSKPIDDPFAEREAKRYDRPIPSREVILALLGERGELLKFDALAKALGLHEPVDLEALERRTQAMVRDGQLLRNRRGGFGIAEKMDLLRGRVQGHPDGFGFVIPDEGGSDLFLSPREMRRIMHGDRVLAQTIKTDDRGRLEGRVVEILERGHTNLVGRLRREGGVSFVVPDEKRIAHELLVPPGKENGGKPDDFVYVEIVEQPTFKRPPIVHVLESLGTGIDAPTAIEIAIRSHDLPTAWDSSVQHAAERIADHVTDADREGRQDLRDVPLVTIDGADAKDFDDAVHGEWLDDGGFRILVAIADVSHYVESGSPLDLEAYERGTSVYFPNRVVPMLPERLSNGICSLRPEVDRLCMVCEMRASADGTIVQSRFFPAVMRSFARLTYSQVWSTLDGGDTDIAERKPDVMPSLHALYAFYQARAERRRERGALEFDSGDTAFRFDAAGNIEAVVAKTRNDAHRLIEECMIAANVEAARFLEKKKLPTLFRVHPEPPEEKYQDLRQTLGELGMRLPTHETLTPRALADVLAEISSRPDASMIQALMLRAQSLAIYQPANDGHFGLALDAYCHFTSPIRRYPDLLVHRALRRAIGAGGVKYEEEHMAEMATHCSTTERRAEEASRDVMERLKCLFVQGRVGEEFAGTVTGVTAFGLFVELDEVRVQGLVHVTQLPNDYYHFDPVRHVLVGERKKKKFRLAQRVRVEILRVDVDEREIDLRLIP